MIMHPRAAAVGRQVADPPGTVGSGSLLRGRRTAAHGNVNLKYNVIDSLTSSLAGPAGRGRVAGVMQHPMLSSLQC